jgi:hypothetical protein
MSRVLRSRRNNLSKSKYEELILAEYVKRMSLVNDIRCTLTEFQKKVYDCGARRICWDSSRRVGKSVLLSRILYKPAIMYPGCVAKYIGTSEEHARTVVWGELKNIAYQFGLDVTFVEGKSLARLWNGSEIIICSASDKKIIERLRGDIRGHTLVVMDEVATIEEQVDTKYLIKEILSPTFADSYKYSGKMGQLILVGTPGRRNSGEFYDACTSANHNGYTYFHSTLRDNEKHPAWADISDEHERNIAIDKYLEEIRVENRWTKTSPPYQREYEGKWVLDAGLSPYIITDENYYTGVDATKLHRVVGVDLGFKDATVFSKIAYDDKINKVYEIDTVKITGLTLSQIVSAATKIWKEYDPEIMVVDPSAGGANLISELQKKYGLRCVTADKTKKASYMELLSADIKDLNVLFKQDSILAEELRKITWNKPRTREAESCESDAHDGFLYGYRYCYHWLPQEGQERIQEQQRSAASAAAAAEAAGLPFTEDDYTDFSDEPDYL